MPQRRQKRKLLIEFFTVLMAVGHMLFVIGEAQDMVQRGKATWYIVLYLLVAAFLLVSVSWSAWKTWNKKA